MTPPRILAAFVRHGSYARPANVPSAHLPHPLTAAGADEARRGAEILLEMIRKGSWRVDAVIDASVLLRAEQTAEIVAETLRQAEEGGFRPTIESFDALMERGLGSAANLTMEEIQAVLAADPRSSPPPAGWRTAGRYRLPLPGAESLVQAGERAARHVKSRMPGRTDVDLLKVFVGHDGAFRYAAVHLGVLREEEAAGLSMQHGRPVILEKRAGGWRHHAGDWKRRSSAPASREA